MGGHVLLQGISLTQGSNLHLLHWQLYSLPLSHQGCPGVISNCSHIPSYYCISAYLTCKTTLKVPRVLKSYSKISCVPFTMFIIIFVIIYTKFFRKKHSFQNIFTFYIVSGITKCLEPSKNANMQESNDSLSLSSKISFREKREMQRILDGILVLLVNTTSNTSISFFFN